MPSPELVAQGRAKLEENVLLAVNALLECIKKPQRNSQTKLAAARELLNRVGLPAVAATTVSNPSGGPVQVTLTIVEPKAQK